MMGFEQIFIFLRENSFYFLIGILILSIGALIKKKLKTKPEQEEVILFDDENKKEPVKLIKAREFLDENRKQMRLHVSIIDKRLIALDKSIKHSRKEAQELIDYRKNYLLLLNEQINLPKELSKQVK
ncbi:MAG: hypothetical protein AABY22_37175 [Nanoarchaeota archaeon]